MILKDIEVRLGNPNDIEWTLSQQNATGVFFTTYIRPDIKNPHMIRKRRLSYSKFHQKQNYIPSTVTINTSKNTILMQPDGRWIDHLDIDEHIIFKTKEGVFISDIKKKTSVQKVETDKMAFNRIALAPEWRWRNADSLPLQWDSNDVVIDDKFRRMNLASFIKQWQLLLHEDEGNQIDISALFLAKFLRAQPAMTMHFLQLIKSGILGDELERLGIFGLRVTATAAARHALITIVTDSEYRLYNRQRAVVALAKFPNPSTDLVDSLRDLSMSLSVDSVEEASLRNSAIYAIGTLENVSRVEHPQVSRYAHSTLNQQLSDTNDVNELASVLIAVGNSGNAAHIESIDEFIRYDNEMIRAKAATALRKMDPQMTAHYYADFMRDESSLIVRISATRSFTEQIKSSNNSPPRTVITNAIESLANETNITLCLLLVRMIGTAVDIYPEARIALVRYFHHTKDTSIKELIGRYLGVDELFPTG